MAQEVERWLEGDLVSQRRDEPVDSQRRERLVDSQRRERPVDSQRRERPVDSQRRERPVDSRAEAVATHLASCAACRAHRRWLRRERDLFAARARADRAPLPDFDAVLARVEGAEVVPLVPVRERSRRSLVDGRAFALSLCAAAALLCVMLPQRAPEGPVAIPELRTTPAATALAVEEADAAACGVETCCRAEAADCETSENGEAQVPPPPTTPEASVCEDTPCRSPDDGTSRTQAVHVVDRSDLTCSEDL
jgi:hypothetical protein